MITATFRDHSENFFQPLNFDEKSGKHPHKLNPVPKITFKPLKYNYLKNKHISPTCSIATPVKSFDFILSQGQGLSIGAQ